MSTYDSIDRKSFMIASRRDFYLRAGIFWIVARLRASVSATATAIYLARRDGDDVIAACGMEFGSTRTVTQAHCVVRTYEWTTKFKVPKARMRNTHERVERSGATVRGVRGPCELHRVWHHASLLEVYVIPRVRSKQSAARGKTMDECTHARLYARTQIISSRRGKDNEW